MGKPAPLFQRFSVLWLKNLCSKISTKITLLGPILWETTPLYRGNPNSTTPRQYHLIPTNLPLGLMKFKFKNYF